MMIKNDVGWTEWIREETDCRTETVEMTASNTGQETDAQMHRTMPWQNDRLVHVRTNGRRAGQKDRTWDIQNCWRLIFIFLQGHLNYGTSNDPEGTDSIIIICHNYFLISVPPPTPPVTHHVTNNNPPFLACIVASPSCVTVVTWSLASTVAGCDIRNQRLGFHYRTRSINPYHCTSRTQHWC